MDTLMNTLNHLNLSAVIIFFAFVGITSIFDPDVARSVVSASHPITWERSVSVTSTFFRLAETLHAEGLVASVHSKQATSVLPILFCAGMCVLIAWLLYARSGICFLTTAARRSSIVGMEWVGLIVASLVFGPQTTNRHLIQLIALFVLAALLVLRGSSAVRRWPIIVTGILVALGLVLPPGGDGATLVHHWRAIGGVSWLTLIFLFVTMQQTLNHCRSLPRDDIPST